ncbi:MAG: hypothetical protein PHD43_23410 [Methylococcales bacterium]|nr:hypothetical protein [Methylococcales bacterium]
MAGRLMLDKPGTGQALSTQTHVGPLSDISAFDEGTVAGKSIVVLILNHRNVGHKQHACLQGWPIRLLYLFLVSRSLDAVKRNRGFIGSDYPRFHCVTSRLLAGN